MAGTGDGATAAVPPQEKQRDHLSILPCHAGEAGSQLGGTRAAPGG